MEKTDGSKILHRFDAIATPEDIYRKAWNDGDLELCASLYKRFQDRLMGRPFVATNPDEVEQPAMMVDARVQTALNQYVYHTEPLTEPLALTDPLLRKPQQQPKAIAVTQAVPQLSEKSPADPLSSDEYV